MLSVTTLKKYWKWKWIDENYLDQAIILGWITTEQKTEIMT